MPNTAIIEREATEVAAIAARVRKERRRLTALLPASIPASRAIETVIVAAQRTPALRECTPESFAIALRESARWGLIPDGVMGQGYLIPRMNGATGQMEAHFQAGYRGLEELARRSGIVGSIVSGWHCQNDPVFEVRQGLHGDVDHVPAHANRGDIVGFYAAAWLTNGAPPVVAYMPAAEVIAIRDKVPYWERGPWRSHYGPMGRKTVVRRLVQQLPLSADMQAIIGLDDEDRFGRSVNVTPVAADQDDASESPVVSKAERVRARLDARRGRAKPQIAQAPAPAGDSEADRPGQAEGAEGESAERTEASDVVTGTVRFVDRPGLNGATVNTPAGEVIGFRLDVDADDWVQVVLSGAVRDRYLGADRTIAEGDTLTVTGVMVAVPRQTPDGVTMPPMRRIIATEDIVYAEDADA